MIIDPKVRELCLEAEEKLRDIFSEIDRTAGINTERVLDAFREERVSESLFAPSTGYGYGDRGRDAVDRLSAKVFGAEAGFMRPSLLSGTHTITVGLFGLLRPGDIMLSVTGRPYDTLLDVIGIGDSPAGEGSLADWGVTYEEITLKNGGGNPVDLEEVGRIVAERGGKVRMVYIQRSRGYGDRPTLSVAEIREIARAARSAAERRSVACPYIAVDNCYGEFTETEEPCGGEDGADIVMGSLIKNPGGGMADTGGYIVGREEPVRLCGNRLTCPGVGLDVGASLGQNRNLIKGLFYAPHTVAQALKTAHLAACVFGGLGFEVSPAWDERRHDIVQTVKCGTPDALTAFCAGIQSASPIDSHVTPEAWEMPGYADPVVMAAGAFTGGSSIELSADGPMRPPYTAYMQGGLTYESARLAVMGAADRIMRLRS